ncbi:Ig-like domain-containing protein [Paenibacillus ferrarius]|uniref:Ig-like domain-containing protein n=1 Tax=Paenibacillus ferrarius TaxID=1469647 RepID=UPI003D28120F
MRKALSVMLCLILSVSLLLAETPSVKAADLAPAFPGAEGGGMYTTGGRGGDVYEVTSLADDNVPGTLRYGVNLSNKIIVFRVSGNIVLKNKLSIKGSNLTIAGQTAPGDGIAIIGDQTSIDGSNIIIRYLRFRTGYMQNGNEPDAFDSSRNPSQHNVVIDHCSISWAVDEVFSVYQIRDTTISWNMIYESMAMSGHQKGRHGFGGIFGGYNETYTHNLIAHNTSRNPRFMSYTGETLKVDFDNNLVYNWGYNSAYGGQGDYQLNFINNYFKPGPSTRENVRERLIAPSTMKINDVDVGMSIYLDGNIVDGSQRATEDNWTYGFQPTSVPDGPLPSSKDYYQRMTTPFDFGNTLTINTAQEAYNQILADAGATLPKRDRSDTRIVNDVRNGTGRILNTRSEAAGFPVLNSAAAPVDSDHDGMPDAWETAHGLNPNNAADGKIVSLSSEGYTNVEVYLNEIVANAGQPSNPDLTVTSPVFNGLYTTGQTISITANAAGKNGKTIAKLEFYDSETKLGETSTAPYSFNWNNASEGIHYLTVTAIDSEGWSTQSTTLVIHVNGTNNMNTTPWTSLDIGSPGIPGAAHYENGVYKIKGSGLVGGNSDSFQYTYQKLDGDGEMVMKVDNISREDQGIVSGIMIRKDLSPDSPMAVAYLNYMPPDIDPEKTYLSVSLKSRANKAESTITKDWLYAAQPYWLKLVRQGNQISSYSSPDGVNWALRESVTIDLNNSAYIGFAVDGEKDTAPIDRLGYGYFSNVGLTQYNRLSIDNPATETVNARYYSLSGQVDYNAKLAVKINGTNLEAQPADVTAGVKFTKNINLNEGLNTIEVTTDDTFGTKITKVLKVTYNKIAPVIVFSSELPDIITQNEGYTLSGSVDKDYIVTVKLNGETLLDHVNKAAGASFSQNLPLQEGNNTLIIQVVDTLGNDTTVSKTIVYSKVWGDQMFTIDHVTFKDYDDNSLTALVASGDVMVNAKVANNTGMTRTGTMVIAVFNSDDEMLSYTFLPVSIDSKESDTFGGSFKLPANIQGMHVKVFMWDSLSGHELLSNTVTLP